VSLIRIYADEDAMRGAVVQSLRSCGVAVLTPVDTGLMGAADEVHLACAAQREYVLYSFNVGDYCRLHAEWRYAGRDHGGIVVAPQRQFSIGEQVRRILRLRAAVAAEAMRNRLEFLGNWR
jgi:hypothetical protein